MKTNWINFLFLLCSVISIHGYKTYYVEDDCLTSPGQRIVYSLSESGYLSSAKLKSARFSGYGVNNNCNVTIYSQGSGVVLTIRELDLAESPIAGCTDFVMIYNSYGFRDMPRCQYLRDSEERRFYSSDKSLSFWYYTGGRRFPSFTGSGFEFTVTSYKESPCSSTEFQCQNSKCIWSGLKCDGRNNCGDNSDESFEACVGSEDVFGSFRRDILVIACAIVICIILFCTVGMVCLQRRRRSTISRLSTVSTDPSELAHISSPYDAIYPAEFGVSRNPAGPHNSSDMHSFTNPCYPYGIPPPPPYKP